MTVFCSILWGYVAVAGAPENPAKVFVEKENQLLRLLSSSLSKESIMPYLKKKVCT